MKSKFLTHKFLFFVAFALSTFVITSCSCEKNNSSSELNIDLEISIKDLNAEKIRCGDSLLLTVRWTNNNSVDDSLTVKFDGLVVYSGTDSVVNIRVNTGQIVGGKAISVSGKLKSGKEYSKSSYFETYSDIKPDFYTYRIVKEYAHNSNDYTQGLFYLNGKIYEGTGQYGESKLKRIDFKTMTTEKSIDLPHDAFGEGVTLTNNKLYQLTWQNLKGFVYNPESFELEKTFTYPLQTEGWGLTHDDNYLIMSDGTHKLHFIDKNNLSNKSHSIEVFDYEGKVTQLNELENVNGAIYANIYTTNNIVRIDPNSGKVLSIILLEGLLKKELYKQNTDVLNGIAYLPESKHLLVTGKNWPKMFEIELVKVNTTLK